MIEVLIVTHGKLAKVFLETIENIHKKKVGSKRCAYPLEAILMNIID